MPHIVAKWTCSVALIRALGGGEIKTGATRGPTQIPQGGLHPYLARNNSFSSNCANNEAEKSKNSHVGCLCAGYKIPQTIIEEEGHRIETPSRGSEWYYRKGAKTWVGVEFLFPHSSARRLPESQQWSPDGAAKAGLIHVLLVQAGGWRNKEVEGHSHQDNHHNSGVWRADKWLMAAINPAQGKRGYYICCGGEWCFAL